MHMPFISMNSTSTLETIYRNMNQFLGTSINIVRIRLKKIILKFKKYLLPITLACTIYTTWIAPKYILDNDMNFVLYILYNTIPPIMVSWFSSLISDFHHDENQIKFNEAADERNEIRARLDKLISLVENKQIKPVVIKNLNDTLFNSNDGTASYQTSKCSEQIFQVASDAEVINEHDLNRVDDIEKSYSGLRRRGRTTSGGFGI